MNKVSYKQVLKDALNWTKQTYLSNPNELRPLHGICKAVEYYCLSVLKIDEYKTESVKVCLGYLIASWPHCLTYDFKAKSGEYVRNKAFPVTTSDVWYKEIEAGTIWKNLKRLELLEYLIQEVNKDE